MNTNQDSGVYSRSGRRSRTSGGGVVLILAGLIALAWTQGLINLDLHSILPDFNMEKVWPGFNWGLAWPIFLLLPGALMLATSAMSRDPEERTDKVRGGILLVALSAFFFASSFGVISAAVWPLLLVIGGGLMLFKPGRTGSTQ